MPAFNSPESLAFRVGRLSAQDGNSLRVVADGGLFEIYSNDRKLFEVEDATFAEGGRVGLWTKADSVTYFDDLIAFSLRR